MKFIIEPSPDEGVKPAEPELRARLKVDHDGLNLEVHDGTRWLSLVAVTPSGYLKRFRSVASCFPFMVEDRCGRIVIEDE